GEPTHPIFEKAVSSNLAPRPCVQRPRCRRELFLSYRSSITTRRALKTKSLWPAFANSCRFLKFSSERIFRLASQQIESGTSKRPWRLLLRSFAPFIVTIPLSFCRGFELSVGEDFAFGHFDEKMATKKRLGLYSDPTRLAFLGFTACMDCGHLNIRHFGR